MAPGLISGLTVRGGVGARRRPTIPKEFQDLLQILTRSWCSRNDVSLVHDFSFGQECRWWLHYVFSIPVAKVLELGYFERRTENNSGTLKEN